MTFSTVKMVLDTNHLGIGNSKESTLDKECKSCTSMFCCLPSESVLAPSLEKYQKFLPEFFSQSHTHTYLSFVCKNNRGTKWHASRQNIGLFDLILDMAKKPPPCFRKTYLFMKIYVLLSCHRTTTISRQ